MYAAFERFLRLTRLIFIVTALTLTSCVLAAPANKGKGDVGLRKYGDATFASEPHGRGTVGILLSCTATFIFCVWTAVHPNVVPGVKSSQRLYYKGVLMVISILIPEGLVVCAIGEFREARRLVKAWNECPKIPEEFKSHMDMRVAFFVVMGGFIVDENVAPGDDPVAPEPGVLWKTGNFLRWIFCMKQKEKPRAPPKSPYRARLTPTGFKKYMEKGLINEQSFRKADILDKGKASTIGKCLAGIQAFWLVVQSISRAGAGLPLSLLEIHVLIHVARTALIYSFWWFKPLDVNEPIRIYLDERVEPGDQAQSSNGVFRPGGGLTSRFNRDSGIDQSVNETWRYGSPSNDSGISSMGSLPPSRVGSPAARESMISFVASPMGQRIRSPAPQVSPVPPKAGFPPSRSMSDLLMEDYDKDPLHGTIVEDDGEVKERITVEIAHSKKYRRNEPKFITSQSPQSFILFHNKAIYDIIIQMDVGDREGREEKTKGIFYAHTRRDYEPKEQEPKMVNEGPPAYARPPAIEHRSIEAARSMNASRSVGDSQPESQRRPGNRSEQNAQATKDVFRFSFVMFCESVLVCLTGALHALAWNKSFPTSIERWLWRGSSLTMCACCLGLFLIANFTEYEQDLIATMWKFHLDLKPNDGFFKIFHKGLKEIHAICNRHADQGGNKRHKHLRYILHQCGVGLALLFVIIYFFSVSYITVESYLSLREAPRDMWLTASWTDYWPHL